MTLELKYMGMPVWALQVWAAAVPKIGTVILGETEAESQATLERLERGELDQLDTMEIELRLILANEDRAARQRLFSDWLLMRKHGEWKERSK
jgi:hypothetical protein